MHNGTPGPTLVANNADRVCLPCFANRIYKSDLTHFGVLFFAGSAIGTISVAALLLVMAQFESDLEARKELIKVGLILGGTGLGLGAIAVGSFFGGTKKHPYKLKKIIGQ